MKTLHTILICSLLAFTSSCVSVLPASTPNVPLLEEKGDAKLTANFVKGEAATGGSIQVAYSPANKFYLGANGNYVSYGDGYRASMTEVSMGTYQRVGRKWKIDLSGGGGVGSNNTWGDYGNSRLFMQSAIGYSKSKFEFAIGGKLNKTWFNAKGAGKDNVDVENFSVNTLDPFFVMRFGGPNIRFQTMFTHSLLINEKDLDFVIPEQTISVGLHFNIGKKKFHL
jgi:hypothetical protein